MRRLGGSSGVTDHNELENVTRGQHIPDREVTLAAGEQREINHTGDGWFQIHDMSFGSWSIWTKATDRPTFIRQNFNRWGTSPGDSDFNLYEGFGLDVELENNTDEEVTFRYVDLTR